MAALNIAFEAPEIASGPCPSSTRPIDLVHLARQTMGDKGLEVEVLQIFARQARSCLAELSESDATQRQAVAHRLKGAASAVGAHEVAAISGRLEEAPTDSALVAQVGSAILRAENFILKLCR